MPLIGANESHVGIAGDWHGNGPWAVTMLKQLAKQRIKNIFHVGDFGLWPGEFGAKYISMVDRALADLGQTIYVTEGNHEWFDKLDQIEVSGDGLKRVTPRIIFMPRGHRWTMRGYTFLSLGGAPSVDFESRVEGVSWWSQEALTAGDVYRLGADVEQRGTVDVMITHDAPKGLQAIERLIGNNPYGFSERAIRYANEGRELLHAAWELAQPKLLFHGHYHCVVNEVLTGPGFQSHVVGLNKDGGLGNIATLSLSDLQVEWVGPEKHGSLTYPPERVR